MANTQMSLKMGDPLEKVSHFTVAVGASSVLVVPVNKKRRLLILVNDGNKTIYFSFGKPAEVGEGIRIEKDGGKYENRHPDTPCHSAVFAVCAGVTNLLVTEGE